MASPLPEQPGAAQAAAKKKSGLAGLNAESTITIALLGVCLIVAGAWWLLQWREEPAAPGASTEAAPGEPAPAAAGAAAPVQWQSALEGKVEELQQQRRAEQERADTEHRRVLEQQQQAQTAAAAAAAEEQRRKAEQERLAAAARAAPPPVSAAPKVQAALVPAKVDWSSCHQPSYPQASIARREEGVVMMAFHVDAGGQVLEKRIDKSSGSPRLDQTALEAIGKCHFTPGTSAGVAAPSWAQMRFVWKLEG